jgi:hypothetical protein
MDWGCARVSGGKNETSRSKRIWDLGIWHFFFSSTSTSSIFLLFYFYYFLSFLSCFFYLFFCLQRLRLAQGKRWVPLSAADDWNMRFFVVSCSLRSFMYEPYTSVQRPWQLNPLLLPHTKPVSELVSKRATLMSPELGMHTSQISPPAPLPHHLPPHVL